MRDPITKLAVVTKETCDAGIYKVLSATQSISSAQQDPIDNHIKINIVYFAGKVVRKTKGMMNSSETSILVVGDQAVYLYQSSNGALKRTIPLKEITKVIIYPQSQLLFSTSNKEYDLLVQFESPAKDQQSPHINFIVNIMRVCFDVLFEKRKLGSETRQTNPLDEKEGNNLKKPEVHREVTIPLTSFRVPLIKSDVPIENLLKPHAPSAQSNQIPPDFQKLVNEDDQHLSPQASAVLKHPLFAGMKHIGQDDEDTETETETETESENNNNSSPPRGSSNNNNNRSLTIDTSSSNENQSAPSVMPMPLPPGASPIAPSPTYSPHVQARGILKKDAPVTEQEEEISKRNEELTRRLKQVESLQRSVEQQQIQAIEMCDYIQRMTQTVREVSRTPPRSVSPQQQQQEQMGKDDNNNNKKTDSGLNDDSSSVPSKDAATDKNKQQQQSTTKKASSSDEPHQLPAALQGVTPAPPALLPDSFVKAVFGDNHQQQQHNSSHHQNQFMMNKSSSGGNNMMMMMNTPNTSSRMTSGNGVTAAASSSNDQDQQQAADGSNNNNLRSTSPGTSATLSNYYHTATPRKQFPGQRAANDVAPPNGSSSNSTAAASEAELEKRKKALLEEAIAEARKQILHEQEEAKVAKPLSPQDLQEEVVRRVRAAEDMFAQRPGNEKTIFRRFHIEQRQRYLTELQAALTTGKRPAPLAYSHFKFDGASDRTFPLAIDIFLTQQELLYLLRIAQAEQPAGSSLGNVGAIGGGGGVSGYDGASENVFAAQQNIYSAPVHQDLGGPLEPLAAHTSPEPATQQQQQQQQQQRWEDLTPEQQAEARRYWANQGAAAASKTGGNNNNYQPQQPQQPQQPTQPGYGASQPVQPMTSPQPRQPVRNSNNAIRPSPGLSSYKNRYRQ